MRVIADALRQQVEVTTREPGCTTWAVGANRIAGRTGAGGSARRVTVLPPIARTTSIAICAASRQTIVLSDVRRLDVAFQGPYAVSTQTGSAKSSKATWGLKPDLTRFHLSLISVAPRGGG